ncbi:Lrp/AsnC family transcriptional regulator [Streptomyces sp. NPDC050549]|uniref:Lrp/AsnC family transcriptional regulator n=1 Tax=Streptomyces sp. NPDC050549 TaxID=3155406 RepID=UPI00343B4FC8
MIKKELETSAGPSAPARQRHGAATAGVGSFKERDLALIDALQLQPRAAWATIGAALGISGSAAARQWERLTTVGMAWVTAYPVFDSIMIGLIEVDCRPGDAAETAQRLSELGWAFSVYHVTGSCDLIVIVSALDLTSLTDAVTHDIGALPGVTGARFRLVTGMYREGREWQAGSLEPRQKASLDVTSGRGRATVADPFEADLPLLAVLSPDGRASYASMASALGVAEHTVRRRIRELVDAGVLVFRCDFAHELAGWPVTMTFRAQVPAAQLDRVGHELSSMPEVRLCVAVTGEANLFVLAWLRSVADGRALETTLENRFPDLRVVDRAVTLRVFKRMGRLLDDHGRATGFVPIATRMPQAVKSENAPQ